MSLDELGLLATIKRYIKKFFRQTDITIDFQVRGEPGQLPETYEITIFRLLQEGLHNIHKHSQANSGRVILEYSQNYINLLISDDGRGFNVEEVTADKFGLISLQERCDLLGGELEIKSKLNQGTKLIIKIPRGKEEL